MPDQYCLVWTVARLFEFETLGAEDRSDGVEVTNKLIILACLRALYAHSIPIIQLLCTIHNSIY